MRGLVTSASAKLIAVEVIGLHQFFQTWFNGTLPKDISTFDRVASVWPPSFTLIDPHNQTHNSSDLLEDTFASYGAHPKLKIRIENLSVRTIANSEVAVALYEEWHIDGQEAEGRLCTAVLVRVEVEVVRWVHIHESRLRSAISAFS